MIPEHALPAPKPPDRQTRARLDMLTEQAQDDQEIRMFFMKEHAGLVAHFLRKGSSHEEALFFATQEIRQLNLVRQAQLPVDLSEGEMNSDNQDTYITSRLARMALLSYPWEDMLPLIMPEGINPTRRVDDEKALCQNCIAACCISVYIPLTGREASGLLSSGTLFDPMIVDSIGFVHPKVKDLIHHHAHGKNKHHSPAALRKKHEFQRYFNSTNQAETHLRPMNSYCGNLNRENFGCTCHDKSSLPKACKAFVEGGKQCEQRYTHRESIAAQYILKIVNDAEPILSAIAFQYGLDRPQGNFVPLTSF